MRLLILAVVAMFALAPARAQEQADDDCGDRVSTPEIVACISRLTATWDRKLNAAYQKLLASIPARQREPLRAAQRLWVQYRDANCLYYSLGEGTIARVEAAQCMLNITQSRAKELAGEEN